MGAVPDQVVGTAVGDLPMDAVLPRGANARQAIDADDNPADFAGDQLVVVGRGDVLMGNPVQFERAG